MIEPSTPPSKQLLLDFELGDSRETQVAGRKSGSNVVQVEFGPRTVRFAEPATSAKDQTSLLIEQVLQSARKLSW